MHCFKMTHAFWFWFLLPLHWSNLGFCSGLCSISSSSKKEILWCQGWECRYGADLWQPHHSHRIWIFNVKSTKFSSFNLAIFVHWLRYINPCLEDFRSSPPPKNFPSDHKSIGGPRPECPCYHSLLKSHMLLFSIDVCRHYPASLQCNRMYIDQSLEFYQLVEPQATVLCSHHSLLEAAGRWSKTRFQSHPDQQGSLVTFPDLSTFKSFGQPDYFQSPSHCCPKQGLKKWWITSFPRPPNPKVNSGKLKSHRPCGLPLLLATLWAPWKTPASCSITS